MWFWMLRLWSFGPLSLETETRFRSDWVFKRQDSNFGVNVMYIYNYILSVIVVKVPTDMKPLLGRKPQCQHSSEIA